MQCVNSSSIVGNEFLGDFKSKIYPSPYYKKDCSENISTFGKLQNIETLRL